MSEITSISPQKHDKMRCNIEVDGRFYCGMTLEAVMQNRLKVGSVVTAEELSRIQLESEKQTALDKALTHISYSMKTEREIRTFLKKKGYLEDVCDFVVDKMKGYGYLDDDAYAKSYLESAGKKKGSRLIAAELKRKGLEDEAIEGALLTLSEEDELTGARKHLEKYLRGKGNDPDAYKKAYRYLLSKGYSYDVAKSAVEEFKDDED